MKLRKTIITVLSVAIVLIFCLGIASAAAGNYGSTDDPLVALSYLKDVFKPEIEKDIAANTELKAEELKQRFEEKVAELEKRLQSASDSASSNTYKVISVEKGGVITCKKGCEILLRVGGAVCVAQASPGLIDTTTSSTVDNGAALAKNHMYMVTIDGRGIKATDYMMVVIRGEYTVS
jgi:hypothetical protein